MISDSDSSPEGIAWLFQPQEGAATKRAIWLWWEKRRPFYNVVVTLAAVVSFLVYVALVFRSPRYFPAIEVIKPIAVLALIIGAPIVWNIVYCLGPMIDIAVSAGKTQTYSPMLLRLELGLSVFAVSIPALYWIAVVLGG